MDQSKPPKDYLMASPRLVRLLSVVVLSLGVLAPAGLARAQCTNCDADHANLALGQGFLILQHDGLFTELGQLSSDVASKGTALSSDHGHLEQRADLLDAAAADVLSFVGYHHNDVGGRLSLMEAELFLLRPRLDSLAFHLDQEIEVLGQGVESVNSFVDFIHHDIGGHLDVIQAAIEALDDKLDLVGGACTIDLQVIQIKPAKRYFIQGSVGGVPVAGLTLAGFDVGSHRATPLQLVDALADTSVTGVQDGVLDVAVDLGSVSGAPSSGVTVYGIRASDGGDCFGATLFSKSKGKNVEVGQ